MISSETVMTPDANTEIASEIFEKSKEDPHFKDACTLLPEYLQTFGFMKINRNNFEHVRETVEAVPCFRCFSSIGNLNPVVVYSGVSAHIQY